MTIHLNLGCSLEAMKTMKDNSYDLAVVDPPYGIGKKTTQGGSGKNGNSLARFPDHAWDDQIPSDKYFTELMRVSKNQIIWGGNYFPLCKYRCFIVWDKMTYIPTMSQVELAYTSFDSPARYIKINSNQKNRFHPTQKPVQLYQWIFDNYASPGMKILDTHLGSGSSAIAAYDCGLDFDGWEINEDYHTAAVSRYNEHTRQMKLFT